MKPKSFLQNISPFIAFSAAFGSAGQIRHSGQAIARMNRSMLLKIAGAAIASSVLLTGGEALAQVYSYGSQGSDVAAIQSALGISADGVYGPETEAAISAFQSRNGLQVDGQAGPETLQALGLGYLVYGGNVGGPSQPVPPVGSLGREAIVRTPSGFGINVRNRPNGATVGGIDDGARVRLSGRQEYAGGYTWAELAGVGGWVATDYLVPANVGGPSDPNYPGDPGYNAGPYVVSVPGSSNELLYQVRRFVPRAYVDSDQRGRFINAGAYQDYSAASATNQQLRNQGFDSRIIYD